MISCSPLRYQLSRTVLAARIVLPMIYEYGLRMYSRECSFFAQRGCAGRVFFFREADAEETEKVGLHGRELRFF